MRSGFTYQGLDDDFPFEVERGRYVRPLRWFLERDLEGSGDPCLTAAYWVHEIREDHFFEKIITRKQLLACLYDLASFLEDNITTEVE
jgi:hypothetical protein